MSILPSMTRTLQLARQGKIDRDASIKDMHSVIIDAPIDKVWKILTTVSEWPQWNEEVHQMTISASVNEGAHFKWTIGGLTTSSQVATMAAPHVFSWVCKNLLIKRIYVWNLEQDEHQTIVTISSSLRGWFTVLVVNHRKVYNELLHWLECLKVKAEGE